MWHGMWGWDGNWAWFGVAHLLWWVVAIGVVVLLVRAIGRGSGGGRAQDRAFAILRERFARGEIDQAEYEQRLGSLRRGRLAGD